MNTTAKKNVTKQVQSNIVLGAIFFIICGLVLSYVGLLSNLSKDENETKAGMMLLVFGLFSVFVMGIYPLLSIFSQRVANFNAAKVRPILHQNKQLYEKYINRPLERLFEVVGSLIVIIVVIGGVFWIGNKLYEKYYLFAEKKPFWKGTDLVKVCKNPYDSSGECFGLYVTLLDDNAAQIHFPSGESRVVGRLKCYFAAEYLNYPRYVFCRSWESDGQQWDLMPTSAYYPSSEEILENSKTQLEQLLEEN